MNSDIRSLQDKITNGSKLVIFGAGQAGADMKHNLMAKGVSVSYFVDNNPIRCKAEGVYSPNVLLSEDKAKLEIIISAHKMADYMAIYTQLTSMGLEKCLGERKHLMCMSIITDLRIHPTRVAFCCPQGQRRPELPILESPEKTISNFIQVKEEIIQDLKNNKKTNLTELCYSCKHLNEIRFRDVGITYVHIVLLPSICNANCIYCHSKQSHSSLEEASASQTPKKVLSILKEGINCGIVNDLYQVAGTYGELTYAPHKDLLYDAVKNTRTAFCTNAFIFDKKIAKLLKVKDSYILVDMDSGTPETFALVKGKDVFHTVLSNLIEYRKYGQVVMKYIIIPGVNDSDDDISGTINILKRLNITFLRLSYDFRTKIGLTLYSLSKFTRKLIDNGITPVIKDFALTLDELNELEIQLITGKEVEYESMLARWRDKYLTDYTSDYLGYREFLYHYDFTNLICSFNKGVKFAFIDLYNRTKNSKICKELGYKFDYEIQGHTDIIIGYNPEINKKEYDGRILDLYSYRYSLIPANIFLLQNITSKYLLHTQKYEELSKFQLDHYNQEIEKLNSRYITEEQSYAEKISHLREVWQRDNLSFDELQVYAYGIGFEELLQMFKKETRFSIIDGYYRSRNLKACRKLGYKCYREVNEYTDIIIAPQSEYSNTEYSGRVLDIRKYVSSNDTPKVFLSQNILSKYLTN